MYIRHAPVNVATIRQDIGALVVASRDFFLMLITADIRISITKKKKKRDYALKHTISLLQLLFTLAARAR